MMTIKEVSSLAGVSVRTLQYYDKIGLLKATAYTQSGYRLYDKTALERLQQILLLRELEFPLKDIQQILSSPAFDRNRALEQQIALLTLKKERMEALISLAQNIQKSGGTYMNFEAFDNQKMASYAKQAKEAWGKSEAYAEFSQKSKDRTVQAEKALGQGLMEIFARMGTLRDRAPDSPEAQALVKELQGYITEHYYRCTDQILWSLGQMYAAGGEFTQNIDAAGGAGTADFACRAIEAFCTR